MGGVDPRDATLEAAAPLDVDGVLLDIDGVIVTSWRPIDGAPAAVDAVRRAGYPVRFVTNTTSRPAAEIADLLRAAGVEVGDGELITAGVATADLLRRDHADARCLVLNDGSGDDLAGIDAIGPDHPGAAIADVVVVGSGGPSFGWDAVNAALRALQGGAALVAMHGSMVWNTAEGACAWTAGPTRSCSRPPPVSPPPWWASLRPRCSWPVRVRWPAPGPGGDGGRRPEQ